MSSFEDIYRRVLLDSSAETIFDRLVYMSTYKAKEMIPLLYPFVQVIPQPYFSEWYQFLESQSTQSDFYSPEQVSDHTKNIIQLSQTNHMIRRVLDLLFIKITA